MTRPVGRTADAAAAALSLDRSSDAPLHAQLSTQLRQMILSARMSSGARLPSSRSLADELSVSRATITLAYDQLVSEGYIEGRQGSGFFVALSLPEKALQAGISSQQPKQSPPQSTDMPPTQPQRPFSGAADPLLFPYQHWARLLHRIWRNPRSELVAAVDAFGWPPLRAAIARHLGEWRGIICNGEQIIITSGVVDATELIARSAFATSDMIHIEEPGHPTLRRALHRSGLVPNPVPVDADGFNLERATQHRAVRGAVVTPSRQFPLGATLPLRRRLAVLEWAASVEGYVVEDDFDGEYRYQGLPLPALMSLDRHGRAIYIGSFSKVLSPTLRLGFIVAPENLVGSFRYHLKLRGVMASLFPQPVLAEFIDEGAYAAHIRRTRRIYALRLDALLAQRDRLDGLLELSPTSAGMHVVADLAPALAERMSDCEAARRAEAVYVTTPPLADFYALCPQRRALLLGFSGFSEEANTASVGRLADELSHR